jgi:S1-C subfamily serine protease
MGRARQLPLLGIAVPRPAGRWDAVYPTGTLLSYAAGITDKLAGTEPGAIAYAGWVIGTPASSVTTPGPAFVDKIDIGGPADYAGLRHGDQILAIDGQPVRSPEDVIRIVNRKSPYQTILIELRRSGTRRTTMLTLGYLPLGVQDR